MARWQEVLKRWRTPLLIGGGGLVAVTAFQRSREQASAAQAAAAIASQPAGTAPALTPEQTAALIAQGGSSALAAAQAGLAPTTEALSLAGLLGTGAQALASASIGNFDSLAGLAGQAIGALPSFAPSEGIQPQPTQPAAPAAAPAPSGSTRRVPHGYRIRTVGSGRVVVVSRCDGQSAREITVSAGVGYTAQRETCPNGVLWRARSGAYSGWGFASWSTGVSGAGLWAVDRVFRIETLSGTTVVSTAFEYVPIAKTGS